MPAPRRDAGERALILMKPFSRLRFILRPAWGARTALSAAGVALTLLLWLGPQPCQAKSPWMAPTPEELAATKSTLEPNAPAEMLFNRVEIDDRDLPRERHVNYYLRYKIYDAEKAEKLLNHSERIVTYDGEPVREVEFQARLHLPDGTERNFGKESVREREIIKQGSADSFWHTFISGRGLVITEKFLAVGSVPAGTVLEYSIDVIEHGNWGANLYTFQSASVPQRHVLYHQWVGAWDPNWVHLVYRLNSSKLTFKEGAPKNEVTLEGFDLPSLADEPMTAPLTDRSATILECYISKNYTRLKPAKSYQTRSFGPEEPWAIFATLENWVIEDHVEATAKVKKVTEDVTRGASDDLAKARRIHDYVQDLYQKYQQSTVDHKISEPRTRAVSMDDVIEDGARHPAWMAGQEFRWLALSMFRAAGLRAESLLLPNRSLVHFSLKLAAPPFLPIRAIALRIGDRWHFSDAVEKTPLPFDELPWEYEGFGGLLALDQKQEFIEVPAAPPERSRIHWTGEFQLGADGTLSGPGKLAYRGHAARGERGELMGKPQAEQIAAVQREISGHFTGAEIEVTDLRHVDDVYEPLEVSFKLTWPGYAEVLDDRLIFRPFVFRTNAQSPFSAKERLQLIYYSYRKQAEDELTIAFPAGYVPEVAEAPQSYPGPVLSYEISLGLDSKRMVLHVKRKQVEGALLVDAKYYPVVKTWYDAVAVSDQHNLVLVRKAETAKPAPKP